eukprot:TRINITY_DN184_c0_g1_i3.p1 TRINITY_DN184_c0_g1~~TRINITY_DN184_c0_g1_i3.p1  ORF type:complete len:371 (+),score=127.41 TRINITY_DN184_c0_g1_i3:156-1268(+)
MDTEFCTAFAAGKMVFSNGTVTADPRKGVLVVEKEPEGLVHVVWKPEGRQNPEDELYVVPGGATFNRVKKVTSGRVYVLQHEGAENATFFWMQDRYASRDEEYVRAVRRAIGQPEDLNEFGGAEGEEESDVPAEDSRMEEGEEEGDDDDDDDDDAFSNEDGVFIPGLDGDVAEALFGQGVLGDAFIMDEDMSQDEEDEEEQEQEEEMMDGEIEAQDTVGEQNGSMTQDESSKRTRPAMPTDLQQFFQMLGQSGGDQKKARTRIKLGSVLSGTELSEAAMRHAENMTDLVEYLPPELQSLEEVFQTLQSPQFQNSIRILDSALRSDFVNVMRSLQLRPAVRGGYTESLLRSIQEVADAEREEDGKPSKDRS